MAEAAFLLFMLIGLTGIILGGGGARRSRTGRSPMSPSLDHRESRDPLPRTPPEPYRERDEDPYR